MTASYLALYKSGELAKRVKHAKAILENCTLCPRDCKVDRRGKPIRSTQGKQGFCKSGLEVFISSHGAHRGEEPPISGIKGSGAIFFTGCNLRCLFCQNYQISHEYQGKRVSIEELSRMMISLQEQGCHNINLVTPTHFVPQILAALLIAISKGLRVPIVYNTNGYDSLDTLKLLDGIVDIYLPDIKYSKDKSAKECSSVSDYVKYNRIALKEMYRQVGTMKTDGEGIAIKGLIIRHLVLPGGVAGSFDSLDFIAKELSKDTCVGLMSQYHPCHRADKHAILKRGLNKKEYMEVVQYAEKLGMDNCLIQELASSDDFLPDFKKEKPFGVKNTNENE
jgi:putative pyruvate formate lyase activating enzyme